MYRYHESTGVPYSESRQKGHENKGYDLWLATVDGLRKKVHLGDKGDMPRVEEEPRRERGPSHPMDGGQESQGQLQK